MRIDVKGNKISGRVRRATIQTSESNVDLWIYELELSSWDNLLEHISINGSNENLVNRALKSFRIWVSNGGGSTMCSRIHQTILNKKLISCVSNNEELKRKFYKE